MSGVTFDGPNRLILVNNNTSYIDVSLDLYSAWKLWTQIDDNSKFLPAFAVTGGDPIGGGLYTGSVFLLVNGWKIRPYEGNHTLTIDGNLFGEAGADIIVPTLGTYTVAIQYRNTTQAQGVSTTGNSYTVEEIATAVRQELTPELAHVMTLENGLTSAQLTMLLELYNIMGLDPTKPLVVTNTSRTAGTITQTIDTTPASTTVQRQ